MHGPLLENNYLIIRNFISSERAIEYAKQFKEYASSKKMSGDHQVPDSHSCYNYIPFLKLVIEKVEDAGAYAGETLLPICAYSRVYRKGNVLKRHKDRPGCEISLTMNLDGDEIWPIWVQKPNGEEVSVDLCPGDALMYLGHAADHWRNEFTGNECVQIFMHYVNANGPHAGEYKEFTRFMEVHKAEMV